MNTFKLLTTAVLGVGAAAAQTTYQIDSAHSAAQFSVRHMMVSTVRGQFSKVSGTVVYDPANLKASKIDATVDASTVDTREEKRDGHLKSPDFFDVAKYPAFTFKSKDFLKSGGKMQVRGDLTMHGVTKEVVLDVDGPSPEIKDPYGMLRVGVTATTHVNRKDYGLTWNKTIESGGAIVGDEVAITLDIEAVRKP